MAEWRFGRGWSDAELTAVLADAGTRRRNFTATETDITPEQGWSRHYSKATIAREDVGPPQPGGPFERAWLLVERYAFSDPRIVRGYFDAAVPLLGRVMLVEIRVLGLRCLAGVVVSALRDDSDREQTIRGFRYDTLEGHVERGLEWFLLTKDHGTGAVTFTVHAGWRPGELPNFWSRVGFRLLVRPYQRAWHRMAHLRLRALLGVTDLEPLPRGALVHEGMPLSAAAIQQMAARPFPTITSEDEAPARRVPEAS